MQDIDIDKVIEVALDVGQSLKYLQGKVDAETKADGSFVTAADKFASDKIIRELSRITPTIPVVSEESSRLKNMWAMKSSRRWVVDPLDGTRSYINGYNGYGIHIGLVEDGEPIAGVACFPSQGLVYYTGNDGFAYRQEIGEAAERIIVSNALPAGQKIKMAAHWNQDQNPKKLMGQDYEPIGAVGGERLCKAAAGDADVAWLVKPKAKWAFSHWDVAAAHAILRAAGGEFFEYDTGKIVTYDNWTMAVKSAIAGHEDVINSLGFSWTKPKNSSPKPKP